MAATPIAFRLAIRDEADEADELLISSVPTDEHPYVTAPPTIDGAEADLIEGTVDVGSATIKFWDQFVAGVARAGYDGFEDYGQTPVDIIPFASRWTSVGPIGAQVTRTTEPSVLHNDGIAYLGVGLAGSGAGAGTAYVERTFTGLPANTDVEVRVWMRPGLIGGAWEVEAQCGMRVIGADGTTEEVYDHEAFDYLGGGTWPHGTDGETYAKQQLRVANRTTAEGEITVRLGCFDYVDTGSINRNFIFDLVEIWPIGDGDGHIYTRELYALKDSVARLCQLSRRARIDVATAFDVEGAPVWEPHHRGYLNRLEVDGGEWTVTVGDTTRQEQQSELFATLPTLDPATLDDPLPMPQPGVGLILGGPVATDPTYGRFADLPDFGTTRWKVEQLLTELGTQPGGSERVVRLKFVGGYLRPWFAKYRTAFEQDEWEAVNHLVQPYFLWDWEAYRTPNTASVNHFGYFPDLLARMAPVGGGTTVQKMPIARPVTHELLKWDKPKAEYDALIGNDSVMYVDWGEDDFPDVNDQFDITLYSPVINEDNPLLVAGHPVDVVAYAAALSGIPIDATWRANAKAAIGEGHWFEGNLTRQKFADFAKALGGAYRFLLRPDVVTGARQFVPIGVRPGSSFAVTMADRVDATEDGSGDGQPPVWSVAEDSVVNVVTFETRRYRQFVFKKDEGRSPMHMLVIGQTSVEGKRGDTTVNGSRTVTFTLPGRMMQRAADGTVTPLVLATYDPENPGYAESAGGVLVDFAGWGVPETVVLVDAASAVTVAQVGDEGTLDLPDLPVPDEASTPITTRGGGLRVVRVVKRTPQVGAVEYTFAHAGELSQDAVPVPPSTGPGAVADAPVLSLAADPAAPTTTAIVSLVNEDDLAALGTIVSIEYVVGGDTAPDDATPTTGAGNIASADSPATLTIGPVAAGSKVWARGTSMDIFGTPYGAPGAWVSVQLVASQDGTSGLVAPALQPFVESTTGTLNVEIRHATAAGIRIATSTTGPVDVADVRAAPLVPFAASATLGTGITPTAGQRFWVAAYAYDDAGNESALGTAQYLEPTTGGGTVGEDVLADFGSGYELVVADFGSGDDVVKATYS